MPSKNPVQRLMDIRDAIAAIRRFVAGYDFDTYVSDQKTVYAVNRAIEIISEASRRLPKEIKSRHPDLDWAAIAAAGNVFRHEYETVDDSLVWHSIHHDLAPLEEVVLDELQRLGEG